MKEILQLMCKRENIPFDVFDKSYCIILKLCLTEFIIASSKQISYKKACKRLLEQRYSLQLFYGHPYKTCYENAGRLVDTISKIYRNRGGIRANLVNEELVLSSALINTFIQGMDTLFRIFDEDIYGKDSIPKSYYEWALRDLHMYDIERFEKVLRSYCTKSNYIDEYEELLDKIEQKCVEKNVSNCDRKLRKNYWALFFFSLLGSMNVKEIYDYFYTGGDNERIDRAIDDYVNLLGKHE